VRFSLLLLPNPFPGRCALWIGLGMGTYARAPGAFDTRPRLTNQVNPILLNILSLPQTPFDQCFLLRTARPSRSVVDLMVCKCMTFSGNSPFIRLAALSISDRYLFFPCPCFLFLLRLTWFLQAARRVAIVANSTRWSARIFFLLPLFPPLLLFFFFPECNLGLASPRVCIPRQTAHPADLLSCYASHVVRSRSFLLIFLGFPFFLLGLHLITRTSIVLGRETLCGFYLHPRTSLCIFFYSLRNHLSPYTRSVVVEAFVFPCPLFCLTLIF